MKALSEANGATTTEVNDLSAPQKAAILEVADQLYGVAHALLEGVSSANCGVARMAINPVLNDVIDVDPLRGEIDLSLSLGLRYIINGRFKFLLNIRRSGVSELTFTLRPVIAIETPATR